MSGLNYLKLGCTLSNICNSTQLDAATKCHYAFKNFWGEPCIFIQYKSEFFFDIKNTDFSPQLFCLTYI